jgi:hypothetical protein
METFSFWHLLILAIWVAAVGWPIGIILRRVGFSPWWAILAFVPLANVVGLWVLATTAWPDRR